MIHPSLTLNEVRLDVLHTRTPDMHDVARGAADVLGSQSVGGFVETVAGCNLPPVAYEVDVGREPTTWTARIRGTPGRSRWQCAGLSKRRLAVIRRCYLSEHLVRLSALERHP